ncbi:igE-binding protein-like [Macrobrachium rosenbergii]|uniref:igE-binding protein-like n=1 Tax=Macrobrachium rosenbergii TaxID=79674 RepID=UPI0034D60A22
MQEATASTCAEALLSSWISRFGIPDHITTDRGPAFLSKLWFALARLLGTTHHTTTAYTPAANGLVERFHSSLKVSLMARCTAEDWKYQLPWVLLGLRTAPRADGARSVDEKTYGESLVVPGELVTEDRHNPSVQRLRDIVGKFAPCKWTHTNRLATFTLPGLASTTHVFIRDDAVRPPLTRP